MRDDEIRRLLRERNPWWKQAAAGQASVGWVRTDPVLSGAATVGIEYDSPVLSDVCPGGLWVLRGPRRVGKSVAAKRLVARLCADEAFDPRQVLYLGVDGFRAQDLRRAFALGRDLTAAVGDRPLIWVIDEVTSVPGWIPVVKELRDNTALASDGVVLTGSSAADLDEARRALGAGRTGVAHPFRLLLPMTFRSYLLATGVPVPLPDVLGPDALLSTDARSAVEELAPFTEELDLAWQRFLECGGFPRAVGENHRRGEVSAEFVSDLLSWLTADVDPESPTDSVALLLSELHRRSAAPLNVQNTASALGSTRERLRLRLTRLVATFGAFWCPRGNDEGRQVENSRSKLYLLDPLLAWLSTHREAAFAPPDMAKLTEAHLALELARAVDRLHPDRFVEQRAVMYGQTTGGNEIDFLPVPVDVGGNRSLTVPIEAKWVNRNWRSEALAMRGRYGHGVLASKNVTDLEGDVWAVPAPVVALLVN